jgi:hypothetical protein
MLLFPKLYGTFRPTWTPAHVEFGFSAKGAANAASDLDSQPAAGTAARASLPKSRLVKAIDTSLGVGAARAYPNTYSNGLGLIIGSSLRAVRINRGRAGV